MLRETAPGGPRRRILERVPTPHPQIPGLAEWQPLARGGFATVWQARQASLDRLVAVKIDQRTLDNENEQQRFLREAGAAGRMSGHPGIVTVHDAGILPDDRPYLVMELCPGGSLTKWMNPDFRPPEARILEVGVRIADALAAAHRRGVLHRDVKPPNILIDAYDNPGLADFGLAALPEPGIDLAFTLEAMTPAYAPPEAFALQPPTERTDVFSLAATLYAVLGGKPPRYPVSGTPTLAEVIELQQRPIAVLPGVDPRFMAVLMSALSDDPQLRPTAAEFRDELALIDLSEPGAESAGVGAAPMEQSDAVPPPELLDDSPTANRAGAVLAGGPPPSSTKRPRTAVLLLALTVLVLLGLLIGALVRPGWLEATPGATPGFPPNATPSESQTATPTPSAVLTPADPETPSSTSSTNSSPTPTGTPPASFADCSDEFGGITYCLTEPECWGGLISLSDLPTLGTPQDCTETHVYQSFAAGELDGVIRRQSQLDEDAQVRSVCTLKTLDAVLSPSEEDQDWEIIALPPQLSDEVGGSYYRCLVGSGERDQPLKLRSPK